VVLDKAVEGILLEIIEMIVDVRKLVAPLLAMVRYTGYVAHQEKFFSYTWRPLISQHPSDIRR
jgi:hypothetical protein